MGQLSTNYLEIVRRASLSRRSFNKVFGIGAHKTGTTSLAAAFQLCGLQVGDQDRGELTSYNARRGRYEALIAYVNTAEAFQDSPFAEGQIYVALDALFPNSKFILTVRDSADWYRSLHQFTAKRYGLAPDGPIPRESLEGDNYLVPTYSLEAHCSMYLTGAPDYTTTPARPAEVAWDKLYDRDHYVAAYEARNAAVRDYFKHRPDQLLEIDLTKETAIDRIAAFLGLPDAFREVPLPHENKT